MHLLLQSWNHEGQQQVLSCHSASTVSHVERLEDTRNPPWQTKGGREMLEKQSSRNILLILMLGHVKE